MAQTNTTCKLRQAILYHLRNHFDEARALYRECIESGHRSHEANLYLGIIEIQHGNISEGLASIDVAKLNPMLENIIGLNLGALLKPNLARLAKESSQFTSSHPPYPERGIGSVDDWRHIRMLEFCQVFADADQTWLTVGDHYGHDAQRLVSLGISRVSASSLSTEYLQSIMNREGIIDVLNINAEEIDLKDNCFDYVVCKEALHHMARPYCAVYEMLRIAKKGVFIVAEPCDPLIDWRSEGKPRNFERTFGIDPIVGPNVTYRDVSNGFQMSKYIDWWETGPYNYVYTVSEREIAKLAQGYGVLTWATKPLGDFYSAEFASQDAKDESKGFEETKTQIKLQELLSSISGIPAPRLHGLLFKEPPNQQITSKLSEIGFTFNKTRTRFLPLTWPNDLELGP